MNTLDFFSTYVMMALLEESAPVPSFFKDRYFPTNAGDIFGSDKVLVEYTKEGRAMAPFVSERVGDISVGRNGYEVHEFSPAHISISRMLTVDDLTKRGFGEALYSNLTEAERAARLQQKDLVELERMIARREEWMAAETMLNNACTMQEYIDNKTVGNTKYVQFYEGVSKHTYTTAAKWDTSGANFIGDVRAMCNLLSFRGLPCSDLLLGTDAAEAIMKIPEIQRLLDKNSGIQLGSIDPKLTSYQGVVTLGRLNFGGHMLNLIEVNEQYQDDNGRMKPFFPATSAMVTAPNCGHMMYGKITQIEYGDTKFTTHVQKRVPKLVIDQENNLRKIVLASRPLAAPVNDCPYIHAPNVCG